MDEAELNELLDAGTSRARAETFQLLRPLTTRVLQLQQARAPPSELAATLQALQAAVQQADPRGLKACWDYLMFPLLLLLESVALARRPPGSSSTGSRSSQSRGSDGGSGGHAGDQQLPAASDRVAEAVVACVQSVLERAAVQEDQSLSVLQKLAPMLQLPRDAASEEVRLRAFSCAATLLQPPIAAATAAAAAPGSSALASGSSSALASGSGALASGSSALASEPLAPLVGALVHSCLEAAATELEAGQRGSKGVRASALQALHALVVAVGHGEALAFFLPGIASGLAKQLLASAGARSAAAPTGAAGGSAATVAALQALVASVHLTLGDAVTRPLLQSDARTKQLQQPGGSAQANVANPLAALQQLAASMSLNGHGISSTGAVAGAGAAAESSRAPLGPLPQPQPERGRLRMQITPEWVRASAGRVETVLAMVLPPLVTHPRASVRVALAEGVASLLATCNLALQQCRQPLLEIMLTLAQDEWPQVSSSAVQWLSEAGPGALQTPAAAVAAAGNNSSAPAEPAGANSLRPAEQGGEPSSAAQALGGLLAGLCQGLPASVQSGEDKGVAHAKRLTTALLYAGPSQVAPVLLQRPAGLSQLINGLLQCFAFDSTGAALLLHARVPPGSYGEPMALPAAHATATGPAPAPALPAAAAARPEAAAPAETATAAMEAATASGHAGSVPAQPAQPAPLPIAAQPGSSPVFALGTASAAASGRLPGTAAVLLPRMPLGLAHLGSVKAYTATANVARALGRLARMADAGGTNGEAPAAGGANLRRIMDALLSRLQQAVQQQRRQQAAHPLADGSWQCEVAAAAAVAAEVMFGASAAWQPPVPGMPQTSAATNTDSRVARSSTDTAMEAAVGTPAEPPSKKQRSGNALAAPTSTAGTQDAVQMLWAVPAVGVTDAEFESLLMMMLEAVTQEALWGVPTSQPEEPSIGHKALSAQVLGENALLLRVLIDACGAAARAAGRRLSGRLLRIILLPLLERLSDPCALVANAADTALCSICMHCGYATAVVRGPDAAVAARGADSSGAAKHTSSTAPVAAAGAAERGGLAALVAANADYVVDGVCRQLRSLGAHPRAPQLLAALLRKAGVGPELVPLLAEPAQAAIKGLSILSRRQQPSHTLPFLHALLEIASGVAQEAHSVQQQLQQTLSTLAQRAAAQEAARQQQEAELEHAAEQAAAAAAAAGGGGVGGADEARSYFVRRVEQKQRVQGMPGGVAIEGAGEGEEQEDVDMEALAEGHKLQLTDEEVEALEVLHRRAYSAALLANAAADAAGPLMYSDHLRTAVLSLDVSAAALATLSHSTRALDAEQAIYDQLARRPADGSMRPARPEPPKLLPAVHMLWGPLLALLRGARRVPLLEKGLGVLGEVVVLGGGQFMAQRFQKEAWPLLARLMEGGPLGAVPSRGRGSGVGELRSSRELLGLEGGSLKAAGAGGGSGGGGGGGAAVGAVGAGDDGDLLAPASVERTKAAALQCLERVASHEDASKALQAIVWPVGVTAASFLADSQPLALREGAGKLLLGLVAVDADAVWLLLVDLARNCPDVRLQFACSDPGNLPSLQQLLPAMAPRGAAGSPRGASSAGGAGLVHVWPQADVAVACGRRAEVLLGQVKGRSPRWHQHAQAIKDVSVV